MYFANCVPYTRGRLSRTPTSNNFFVEGVGFRNDKQRSAGELSGRSCVSRNKKDLDNHKKITVKPGKRSPKTLILHDVGKIVNKTESCLEEDDDSNKWGSDEIKEKNGEIRPSLSAITKLNMSRRSTTSEKSAFSTGDHTESKFYDLFEKYGGWKAWGERPGSDFENNKHNSNQEELRHRKAKCIPEQAAGGEKLKFELTTEKETMKKSRHCDAVSQNSHVSAKTKSVTRGMHSAERLRTQLNCVWSRGSSIGPLEDEDYQFVDLDYLLRGKQRTVSPVPRGYDDSVIDLVAKENSVEMMQDILPPVCGSKWTLKNRYVSELCFDNLLTPVLREYARISQARVVDFSEVEFGSDIHVL